MIPGAPVAEWELSAEELRPAGLAHGFCQVSSVEDESLLGEAVDVGRFGVLAAVDRKVIVSAIVRHYDEDVGLFGGLERDCQ